MQNQLDYSNLSAFKRAIYSPILYSKKTTQQIAYIALTTAFVVIANMFFEFKLLETQFSFTIVICALAGVIIGAGFGFVSAFLGDLLGFLYNSAGMLYLPWVGISMGIVAFISGVIINGIKGEGANLFIKIALVSLTTFLVCTVAINTTAFWLLYTNGNVGYFEYLFTRLILKGQLVNSLINYALLFVAIPTLSKIKSLNINYR